MNTGLAKGKRRPEIDDRSIIIGPLFKSFIDLCHFQVYCFGSEAYFGGYFGIFNLFLRVHGCFDYYLVIIIS